MSEYCSAWNHIVPFQCPVTKIISCIHVTIYYRIRNILDTLLKERGKLSLEHLRNMPVDKIKTEPLGGGVAKGIHTTRFGKWHALQSAACNQLDYTIPLACEEFRKTY